ncbi:MAG: replicative DNA helicase [Lactobacillaceae bacterium]|jgi:replicative DNA helicase|nr:replicative DNA helicase [Lactobacillaceae bacterium]
MADEQQNNQIMSAPQDILAEQAVLGSILISTSPTDTLADVNGLLTADDFIQTRHRLIFKAMIGLDDQVRPIDTLTLVEQLNSMAQLENAGGETYLAELGLAVPIAGNAPEYARIVREKSIRRQVIDVLVEGTQEAYTDTEKIEDLVAKVSTALDATNQGNAEKDFREIRDVVTDTFDQIEMNARSGGTVVGLATGYPALDNMTTGFRGGQMIVLAARPGLGKTAFVLNVAKNVAVADPKLPVALFSLEMPAVDLVSRMIAAEGNIHSKHMRTGQLEDDEWSNLTIAMASLANTKIFIDDTAGIKVTEIRSKLRRLIKQEGPLGLVVIDYLQLIEGTGPAGENRQQQITGISRAIKKMAMEMNVPIIALSQLSRGVEGREDKRPKLSDIRESGAIEQDADIVAFLYRDDYYERDNNNDGSQQDPRDNDEADVGEMEVILEKNRQGERGTAKILFVKSYNKFSNIDFAHGNNAFN